MPDRIGQSPVIFGFEERRDRKIVAVLSHLEARTTEQICEAVWPGRGVDGFTWPTVVGRLNSLQRRGVVVRVAPKRWRRSWLVPREGWQ
jgi:hypothetical protein